MTPNNIFTLIIIIITLAGVAAGRYPILRMNRATIALVGAAVIIMLGSINLEDAYAAIDLNTIVLIFSMMVLNVNLRLCGFFKAIASFIISISKTPRLLLFYTIISSGILSSLFLNDTIVIMFTPLLLEVIIALKRNPVPYLIALAASANIGSAGTIVGNPQNMLIGTFSGISFIGFASSLMPVALLGLFIVWLVVVIIYRKEFGREKLNAGLSFEVRIYKPLLIKSIISLVLMLSAFLMGMPVPLAALGAASLLLFTRRIKPERVFKELDWSLLIFFSGLFIVTDSLNSIFISNLKISFGPGLSFEEISYLTFISTLLSNVVSNVPAVLLLNPVVSSFSDQQTAWLIIAMSTTFAGNLTLLGSVANMIVAESAKNRGVKLKFTEYLKAGIPITVISLLLGIVWFSII